MKKFKCIIIIMLVFILSSCNFKINLESPSQRLEEISKSSKIEYLTDATIKYYFSTVGGFRGEGLRYMFLQFSEEPKEFLNQSIFITGTKPLYKGRNEEFERRIEETINLDSRDEYEKVPEMYRINWNDTYLYFNTDGKIVSFPFIYFVDSFSLIIIQVVA